MSAIPPGDSHGHVCNLGQPLGGQPLGGAADALNLCPGRLRPLAVRREDVTGHTVDAVPCGVGVRDVTMKLPALVFAWLRLKTGEQGPLDGSIPLAHKC